MRQIVSNTLFNETQETMIRVFPLKPVTEPVAKHAFTDSAEISQSQNRKKIKRTQMRHNAPEKKR